MRTYAGQFLLLTVDPVSGRLYPIPEQIMHLTLAGALLFDASFKGFINDDWEKLEVLKTPGLENPVLDEALRCLLIFEKSIPIKQAVEVVAAHGSTLSKIIWDSLQKQGILTTKKQPVFTGGRKQDMYSPDLSVVLNIHKLIRETILTNDIPDFEVPPLISLIEASGLTKYIFQADEANQYKERITLLAGMESLGREIVRAVNALEHADMETDVAKLIGLQHDQPKTFAGGMDAVLTALGYLYKETGMNRSRKLIGKFNQFSGFECPGCAWPNPDKHRSRFEFCENGAKNVSSAATTNLVSPGFFEKWPVKDLLLTSEYWLEQQGRLTDPMYIDENSSHYKPVSWDDAYKIIADELNSLDDPNQAVFYASGRTSNEAAFLYQLLARALGTNNLPNSANICHEPSGKALSMSLGYGKSSVTLDDFPKAGSIFIFGHNPGSNHARMLSSLQAAVRNGCKIVAINPMPEASLMGFADPQKVSSYLGKQTSLSHLYIQPVINGDMALVRGMAKALFEEEEKTGGILDNKFIGQYTSGFEEYKQTVLNTSWDEIVISSGVDKSQIIEAANVYRESENTIACWCLGITHHRNSVETIREIVNLLMLKGNVGKPGSGVCPVRGHSNIQGIRTVGVGENMPASFLDNMENLFGFQVPHDPGLSTVPAIQSIEKGKVKILISLGGNLASALPDTKYIEETLRKCNLTVMISTKLNRSHLVTGKKALILPAFTRIEEDIQNGKKQITTVEDAMCKISFSKGCLPPPSENMKSEISIVAGIAKATLKGKYNIDWDRFENDYHHIRTAISKVVTPFKDIADKGKKAEDYYYENPLKKRVFNTSDQKAQFSNYALKNSKAEKEELLLMTIRSHDQFNTSIFGLNDRYRGINNERRVLFMNKEDMFAMNIEPEQLVEITSNYDNRLRKLEGYYAIPYPISKGCVAAYFPEANILTSINEISETCFTPAFKSVRVKVNAS
ncbi:MAG: FdhF/YdeP family oxidoreductase [Prolixibacteraceae bacterium]|nr:FdhF/YdeP family oxidoreductase [Prolixibacteraceae bacterium]